MPATPNNPRIQSVRQIASMEGDYDTMLPTLRQKRMGREAVSQLLAAAQRGMPAAQRELGLAHFRGLGVQRDLACAFKWLTLAAEAGDAQAFAHLEILLPGLSGEDIAEGRRLMARFRGEPEPEYGFVDELPSSETVGDLVPHRLGVKEEFQPWQPAEGNEQPMQAKLKESIVPFAEAAAADEVQMTGPDFSALPGAMTRQGILPTTEPGFLPAGRRWVTPLAFSMGVVVLSLVLVVVGKSLLMATDQMDRVATDEAASSDFVTPFKQGAALVAQRVVQSESLPADAPKLTPLSASLPVSLRQIPADLAARWRNLDDVRDRAIAEDADAQFDLAQWHLLQAQSTNDFAEAVRLLKLAASSGRGHALNNLGFCLVTGTGAAQDSVEAYKCFALATVTGLQGARGNRERLASMLTPQQLAEASGRVAAVIESYRRRPDHLPAPEELPFLDPSSLGAEPDADKWSDSRPEFLAPSKLPFDLGSLHLGP